MPARVGPGIRQLALYEPAILTAADQDRYTGWVPRFDQEMSQGWVAAAMITSMFGGTSLPRPSRSCRGGCWRP